MVDNKRKEESCDYLFKIILIGKKIFWKIK